MRYLYSLCILIFSTICGYLVWSSYRPVDGAFARELDTLTVVDAVLWVGLPILIGMIFGQLFDAIRQNGPHGIVNHLKNSKATYLSALASPLVFFGIITTADVKIETFQNIAFAFQNGFFINSFVATLVKERGS